MWAQPKGQGVDRVREALAALEKGTGDYAALKAAVSAATFAVRPTALSVEELAENWEYLPMLDTITDTIQVALFTKVITMEQFQELQTLARFTGPEPSREPA